MCVVSGSSWEGKKARGRMQPPSQKRRQPDAAGGAGNTSSVSNGSHTVSKSSGPKPVFPMTTGDYKVPENRHRSDKNEAVKKVFLDAFEKPTQIYRYLSNRHSKLFLHRNLSYMKGRMSRNHKRRQAFRVNDMLERVNGELEAKASVGDLHLNFMSFEDRILFPAQNGRPMSVSVEARVRNVYEKDGKEYSSTLASGIWDVPVLTTKKTDSPGVSCRSADKFNHFTVSRDLFSKITPDFNRCVVSIIVKGHPESQLRDGSLSNGDNSHHLSSPEGRRRSRSTTDSSLNHSKTKVNKSPVVFKHELVIFDRKVDRQLFNGSYQIVGKNSLKDKQRKEPEGEAKLNIRVNWTETPHPSSSSSLNGSLTSLTANRRHSDSKHSAASTLPSSSKENVKVCYRFFNNQTDYQNTNNPPGERSFHCPWCQINCLSLRPLIGHLKHSHPRFHFRVRTDVKPGGGRTDVKIDVSVNDAYDGSCDGNLHAQYTTGLAFARDGPVRRNPVTVIHVNKRGVTSENIIDPEDDDDVRPTVIGHERLYYHTNTCTPIRAQDMNVDSEDENDPQWMRLKTQQVCILFPKLGFIFSSFY